MQGLPQEQWKPKALSHPNMHSLPQSLRIFLGMMRKKELNIQTKEVQLYTKRQIEKILAEQNREFMIGITVEKKRDKNRNIKYILL